MFDVSPEEITEGPLLRSLLTLAAPLLVQNLVQVLQQVVDLFWLGRLSDEAVAATGLVFPLMALLFALVIFAPFVGTQVLVSQRVGGEAVPGARRSLVTGLAVALALSVGVGVLAFLAVEPLVELLTVTQPAAVAARVSELGAAYLGVIALGLPLFALGDTVEAGFVGWGDSRASLAMNVTTVAVNVVLDPVLIFGWGPVPALGIRGAALATVLGATTGLVLGAALVALGRNGGMVSRAAATLDAEEARDLLEIGAPTAAQNVASQLARVAIVTVAFAAGGAAALAAYIVGGRVATVAFVPASGLQQAAQSVVGQNIGAGSPERARRATWLGVGVAAAALAAFGAVQWLLPVAITELFVPALGTEALDLSVEYLRILAYGYPAIGALYLFQAGFNGARRTRTSLAASLLQYWAVRFPIAAGGALLLGFGVSAVFWAVTLSNVAVAVGLGLYYRYATDRGMLDRAVDRATG